MGLVRPVARLEVLRVTTLEAVEMAWTILPQHRWEHPSLFQNQQQWTGRFVPVSLCTFSLSCAWQDEKNEIKIQFFK
ncbi:hypothetical protein VTO42DRAFT_6936 [Malbranchea cinnamomea]